MSHEIPKDIMRSLVLRLAMVDKSTSPRQTHFGRVFSDEAVQTGLLFPALPPSSSAGTFPISSQHDAASTSGFLPLKRTPVLPLNMVENSTSLCKRISGWFSPHSTVQVG
ncbi:MAG TPA: hypothetical protein VF026_20085 [Ktedonobacteraceae bacterium]